MLNFDEARFVRIQSGAVALAAPIDQLIDKLLAAGKKNIFFLGTGGAAILMQPAAQLLQRHSTFASFWDFSAELVLDPSLHLGADSIVIIPSRSGTTKESVDVLGFCRGRGATVVTLVGNANTPLATAADHCFVNFCEDDTSSECFYLQALLIALSIMKHRGECPDYDALVREIGTLPKGLAETKRAFEPRAADFAAVIKSAPYHIIAGAGSTWSEAFYYGMCILEEMQWIRTRPIHASDFFHGTLELVEQGVSVILFKGEDASRPIAERLEAFVPTYTQKLTVLDTKSLPLPGVSERLRALISPVLLATVLERVSAHLEVQRNHPLTTRRYYNKVAY
jgi:fructoselysine-6-phosphate deglycase